MSFWAPGFWATGFWAEGFWSGYSDGGSTTWVKVTTPASPWTVVTT